ncbi:site-specific DNA-methyltransferase [Pantoea sp. ICBG 1758]|uniref:DNA-methyltransferase n=1 Tax=Pantoea sp. ICBG 1758 TaxID=2071682 RepID=UPI000CE49212|nr:DNA methyltransferase [Pantoea sp. ICBG 1758]PPC63887.1 site-specific DNA-methyltransferase [Pantoea sp. ICBG 1758]
MKLDLHHGDCLDVLKTLPENSVDSIITDPPYGLSKPPDMTEVLTRWLNGDDYEHRGNGFMGKSWDSFVPGPSVWRECLRVLKPGGHLLSFFGARTYDLGTTAIRMAGFEIRDQIMWVYGSGFPKSHNISKAIDKSEGVEPTVIGHSSNGIAGGTGEFTSGNPDSAGYKSDFDLTVPTSEHAKEWDGWGTALKPAHEPICMARKPFSGPVAANVLAHGTGAINIDACRIGNETRYNPPSHNKPGGNSLQMSVSGMPEEGTGSLVDGRWPANFCHDGSVEVTKLFPHSSSTGNRSEASRQTTVKGTKFLMDNHLSREYNDSGSVARYFYCAKTGKLDREEGVSIVSNSRSKNNHPTVKPTSLMGWLCLLVTPPGGTILDPYMGSGSTGKAAAIHGFDFIGIEKEADYLSIARQRIEFKRDQKQEE